MTFLELVQAVHRETGAGGTAPTSFANLTGEAERLKNYVRTADMFIQNRWVDWNYLWGESTVSLLSGTYQYSPVGSGGAAINSYDRETFFIGENKLAVVSWFDVRGEVREDSSMEPFQVVIMPDNSLRVDGTPDDSYTLNFAYYAKPVAMTLVDDESAIPAQYHDAIVGKAIMYYAEFENAPEQMQKGQTMFADFYMALESHELPGDRYQHRQAEGGDMVIEVA